MRVSVGWGVLRWLNPDGWEWRGKTQCAHPHTVFPSKLLAMRELNRAKPATSRYLFTLVELFMDIPENEIDT